MRLRIIVCISLAACSESGMNAGGIADSGTVVSRDAALPAEGREGDASWDMTFADAAPGDASKQGDVGTWAVCPSNVEPTFESLNETIFQVSCGVGAGGCHSKAGALYSGGLDLETDPYAALVLRPANNIEGSERGLMRVVPREPESSFLFIKLSTTESVNQRYGSGMPFGQPGSVCPEAMTALRDWIAAGASR